MDLLKWIAIALAALAVVLGALYGLGAWRWNIATRALIMRLDDAGIAPKTVRYDAAEIANLPAPLRRYFELVLTDGQPIIRAADIALKGGFNMSFEASQWKPFTSEQRVITSRPGFVWNARIRLFPVLPVRVHDAYVAGTGLLRPSVLGLVSLGEVQGKGDIARGELMRWLAKSVWYPTALLPSQGIEWQPEDATSALATLTDGDNQLTMLFRFGDDGLIAGIRVEARGALVDGETVMMPWVGRFRDYRIQNGMRIPFFGEVAWVTPQGDKPYFRGSVARLTYHFAE